MNRNIYLITIILLINLPTIALASRPIGVGVLLFPLFFFSFVFLLLSFILIKKLPVKINYFMIILSLFVWSGMSEHEGSKEDVITMLFLIAINIFGIIVYYYRSRKETKVEDL